MKQKYIMIIARVEGGEDDFHFHENMSIKKAIKQTTKSLLDDYRDFSEDMIHIIAAFVSDEMIEPMELPR